LSDINREDIPHFSLIRQNSGNFRSRSDGSHYPVGNVGPNPIDEAVKRMNEKKCTICGITSTVDPSMEFVDSPLGGFICKRCLDKKALDEAQKQDVKDYTYPEKPEPEEPKEEKSEFDIFGGL